MLKLNIDIVTEDENDFKYYSTDEVAKKITGFEKMITLGQCSCGLRKEELEALCLAS